MEVLHDVTWFFFLVNGPSYSKCYIIEAQREAATSRNTCPYDRCDLDRNDADRSGIVGPMTQIMYLSISVMCSLQMICDGWCCCSGLLVKNLDDWWNWINLEGRILRECQSYLLASSLLVVSIECQRARADIVFMLKRFLFLTLEGLCLWSFSTCQKHQFSYVYFAHLWRNFSLLQVILGDSCQFLLQQQSSLVRFLIMGFYIGIFRLVQ